MSAGILHQASWAYSAQGLPIELFNSWQNQPSAKVPTVLFIGGLHGDEPEGVRLAQDLLQWLQKNNSDLCHWGLIPCLNPEGFANDCRTNSRGVDLNRNFPSHDWSSVVTASRYHPGTAPASEPEVQALLQLLHIQKPDLIVHFHSWKPCVVYTGTPAKTAAALLATGTNYPVQEDIGYPTPGSLGQYAWQELQIPVICLEAQEHSDLQSLWPIFSQGLILLLQSQGRHWRTHK